MAAAATYVSAAAPSTARAPAISCGWIAPVLVSCASARLDASISTGSVTRWNSTAPAKNAMPRSMRKPASGMRGPMRRPTMNSGQAAALANPTAGAIDDRNASGR